VGELDGETTRVVLAFQTITKAYNERLPLFRRATGIGEPETILETFMRFDGSPLYDPTLWAWDDEMMAYRYNTPFTKMDAVPMLLTWDAIYGWMFRPDTVDTLRWAPLYEKADQRNRPDQVFLAMIRLVYGYVETPKALRQTISKFRSANVERDA